MTLWHKTTAAPAPMFPITLTIRGVSLKLFADGTYVGDVDAFEKEMQSGQVDHWMPQFGVYAWLVVKEARRMADAAAGARDQRS